MRGPFKRGPSVEDNVPGTVVAKKYGTRVVHYKLKNERDKKGEQSLVCPHA